MRRIAAWTAAAAIGLLVVTACHGGGSSSKSAAGDALDAGTRAAMGQSAGASAPAAAAGGNASVNTPGKTTETAELDARALIRTAELTVRVDDVTARANRAVQIARATGGDLTSDAQDGTGASAHADLVLTVPTASMGTVLDQLARLGQTTERHSGAEDVTTKVADVNSRVASMRAAIVQLRTLYNRAGSITEILRVEGELSRREADLESLESQQRSLAAQTAQATITLHLVVAVKAATKPPHRSTHGFLGGLDRGWTAFTTSVGWLLTALGALLPFVALAGLALAGFLVVRRRRPRATTVVAGDGSAG